MQENILIKERKPEEFIEIIPQIQIDAISMDST